MCALSYGQSKTSALQNDIPYIQVSMFLEDDVLRKHRILDQYKQGKHARAFTYDCAEVISGLYTSGRERRAKRTVALLHAEKFELSGI